MPSVYDLPLMFHLLPNQGPAALKLLPITALLLLLLASPANAFTFRFTSAPQQCSETSAIWQGGTAPYKLLLLPIGFQPQGTEKRVIYEKTVTSGNELGFIFPFPANSRFVAVMSDATGFGTGGTSPILTVASSNTTSCLPTTPSEPQFYLYLSPTTPAQCSPVTISWDTPRNPPVTVYGVIPQGQSFTLDAARHANGRTSFDWTVNVRSGTPFFFVAGDGNGSGTGGSTDVQNVKGGPNECINDFSPSSTPDTGVGSVNSLPPGGGGTVTGTATATPTGGNGTGSGNGDDNGNGNGNGGGGGSGDSNGSGSGNGGGGGGNDNGSGGGTVHGPLDPTSVAGASNDNSSGPNVPMILGIVLGLLGLVSLATLLALYYKRKKAAQNRRENQRARLLTAGDFSQTNLPQMAGAYAFSAGNNAARGNDVVDLPHPRPPFAATSTSRGWPYGGSLESLGSNLRSTPFIWPLGSGSNANSPVESRSTPRTPRDRDSPASGPEVAAVGTTTARPELDHRSTGSSGVLRRLRSVRYGGGSGFGFGFPFGGGRGGGYRSLGEGDEMEDLTPSSGLPNPMTNNNSGSGLGHTTTPSNDSDSSAMHKSPLPAGYVTQHTAGQQHQSQNSHGSNGSRFSSQVGAGAGAVANGGNGAAAPNAVPLMSMTANDSLERPGVAPLGPRPAPGLRPSFGREDTGGSVWEVPPTYASLRRQGGRHE